MYQLLIVCPNEQAFVAECNRYALHKRDSGINCLVHPFDHNTQRQELRDLPFLRREGVDPSLLDDAAACLKVDLLRYYRGNTRYVLLAGDVDRIPVPWFEFRQSGNRYFYPTDLYYADLTRLPPKGRGGFQTWDPDGDTVKGEFSADQISPIDFKPDLSIGRIPASKATELRNAFTRLINRQASTPRCLVLRGNDPGGSTQWLEQTSSEAASRLRARGYTVTSMSLDANASPMAELNTLNQLYATLSTGVDYIFWFGHGGLGSWGYFGPHDIQFSNIIPRTNGSPIVFSMSCDVGQFNRGVLDATEYYSGGVMVGPYTIGQTPPVPDSLQPSPSTIDADFAPEMWLVRQAGGASALIAGHSWGRLGSENLSTQPLDFIRHLPMPREELQSRYVGDAYNGMLYSYIEHYRQMLPTNETALNHLLRMNLFGDPTTPLFC